MHGIFLITIAPKKKSFVKRKACSKIFTYWIDKCLIKKNKKIKPPLVTLIGFKVELTTYLCSPHYQWSRQALKICYFQIWLIFGPIFHLLTRLSIQLFLGGGPLMVRFLGGSSHNCHLNNQRLSSDEFPKVLIKNEKFQTVFFEPFVTPIWIQASHYEMANWNY